jgi:hypothetical protein
MKKIIYLSLLILSFVGINSCEDGINGTKDINYVSFQGATSSIVVEKNSTASKDIKIYTTQITGSERTFNIKVLTALSTADPASYTVPATVTVPANANVGTFTVNISDVNIVAAGVKLVLGFESQDGLFTGSNITINMTRICTFNINDFIGNFIITEKGYGDYATTITKDASVANRIWITNFWDYTNDLAYYDFNPTNGTVTMPSQVLKMGDGKNYTCIGTGTYNACAGTFHMTYTGDVAGTVHDFARAK